MRSLARAAAARASLAGRPPLHQCGFCSQSPEPQRDGQRLMESLEHIMSPETRAVTTERWDWHLWQLFTALLPACGILGVAAWADHDMAVKGAALQPEEDAGRREADAGRAQEAQALASDQEQLRARLDAIERRLEEVAASQREGERESQPAAAAAAPEACSRQREPPLPPPQSGA